MSDNKSFEQLSIEQESGYPITIHDAEPNISFDAADVVGKDSGRREGMKSEKVEPKTPTPKMANLDQGSIDYINRIFKEQRQKLDEKRVIFYSKDLIAAGKAHQDLVNGLTASNVYQSRDSKGSQSEYSGISNAAFPAGEGMILTFAYPENVNMESHRVGTDKLLRHANALLEVVGAKILIPIADQKK